MKVTADVHKSSNLMAFVSKLESGETQKSAAKGLNEHAKEQTRQSVKVMAAKTAIPKGRVSSVTRTITATPSANMTAKVQVKDQAIGLHEYGSPYWVRDLHPKFGKGAVSTLRGAEASGWNRRKVYPGTFVAKGKVFLRKGDGKNAKLKMLSGPVLANELADQKKTNYGTSVKFAELDLARRVLRYVSLGLGI